MTYIYYLQERYYNTSIHMRLLRSTVLWCVFLLFTILVLITTFPFMLFKNPLTIRIAVFWARCTSVLLGIHVETKGMELFYTKGPCIIMSNHQSLLDIIVMLSHLPVRFTFMAKSSLFKIPVFGWGMHAAGCIPVDRNNRKKAQESLYKAAQMIRDKKIPLIVYPEGTFGRPDGTLGPFKKGGFVIASKAGVTLQPLTIWGTANIIPDQPGNWIPRIFPHHVTLIAHKPLPPNEFKSMATKEISAHIQEIISEPIARFQKEEPLTNSKKFTKH